MLIGGAVGCARGIFPGPSTVFSDLFGTLFSEGLLLPLIGLAGLATGGLTLVAAFCKAARLKSGTYVQYGMYVNLGNLKLSDQTVEPSS